MHERHGKKGSRPLKPPPGGGGGWKRGSQPPPPHPQVNFSGAQMMFRTCQGPICAFMTSPRLQCSADLPSTHRTKYERKMHTSHNLSVAEEQSSATVAAAPVTVATVNETQEWAAASLAIQSEEEQSAQAPKVCARLQTTGACCTVCTRCARGLYRGGGGISWHFNFAWESLRFKLTAKFPTRNSGSSANFSHTCSTHCGLWRRGGGRL